MTDRARLWLSWTAAVAMSVVFLTAGIWKLTDPPGAAARLAQAKVPEALSMTAAVGLGIAETLAGLLFLLPGQRRRGAILGGALLIAFMIFIGVHYSELRGEDCSCFPWLKRAVGPGFFMADVAMFLLAAAAGLWARKSGALRGALLTLLSVAAFAGTSYAVSTTWHHGTRAPDSIMSEDGHAISLRDGKVFIYFFNPQCMHCLEAGKRLAALDWGSTRFIGVATENPRFAGWFMGKAGLRAKGIVSKDFGVLKKAFPFDVPPAGVALQDGYERAMLLQFEEKEPRATLTRLGFIR